MIVPVPMFIPVPIPIPIPTCLTALSQALMTNNSTASQQGATTPICNQRQAMTTPTTPTNAGEKRYTLKRQPMPDAPE